MPTGDVGQHGEIVLPLHTARQITRLLNLLAELPSTPGLIAVGAQQHLRIIENRLPAPHHPQQWDRDRSPAATVRLDMQTALAVIELLGVFDEMPSTPPELAADARQQAAQIREQLDRLADSDHSQ